MNLNKECEWALNKSCPKPELVVFNFRGPICCGTFRLYFIRCTKNKILSEQQKMQPI